MVGKVELDSTLASYHPDLGPQTAADTGDRMFPYFCDVTQNDRSKLRSYGKLTRAIASKVFFRWDFDSAVCFKERTIFERPRSTVGNESL